MLYAQEVDAGSVGRRVSVRWATPDGLTDVVGVLVSHDGAELVVRRRDGLSTSVPAARVVGSRIVPDRPDRPDRPRRPL